MALSRALVDFPNLSHHAFQHPLDSQALATLRQVPGLPALVKFLSENTLEQFSYLQNVSSSLRVSARQYPTLYKQFVRMAQVLDVRKLPSLYIQTTPTINAYAMGMENYSIVLCSGLIDIMDEDELLAILGHELGHVKCEHQLYKSLAHILGTMGNVLLSSAIPLVGNLLSSALQLALLEWNRKAEFSCDRAALLATQDVDAVSSALAKLAGYSKRFEGQVDIDSIVQQADEYHEIGSSSLVLNLAKMSMLRSQTHPFPVVRVKELRLWAQSPEYRSILAGRYRRLDLPSTGGTWPGVVVGTTRCRTCPNPACRYPCDDDFVFCPACQSNVRNSPLQCSRCRAVVNDDWFACANCGQRMLEQPPALPPPPAARITGGENQPR